MTYHLIMLKHTSLELIYDNHLNQIKVINHKCRILMYTTLIRLRD